MYTMHPSWEVFLWPSLLQNLLGSSNLHFISAGMADTCLIEVRNCEFLLTPKTEHSFLCELPVFQLINGVYKFIGY